MSNTITRDPNQATDSPHRERPFRESESRRLAVAITGVDRAIACYEGRCKCNCREELAEIIARHQGSGDAA